MGRLLLRIGVTTLALLLLAAAVAALHSVLHVGSAGGMALEVFASLLLSALLVAVTVFYAWSRLWLLRR